MEETIVIGTLSVHLTRKRIRNINLRIRPDGTVHVSAPTRVPRSTIVTFVESKRSWIEENLAKVSRQSSIMVVSCLEGDSLWLWGQHRMVRIVPNRQTGQSAKTTFECLGDELFVHVRERDAGNDEQAVARRNRALEHWLKEQLSERIAALLPHCEEVVGRHASAIRIKAIRSRWGSCNTKTGTVSIALRLVHFDPRCLEMVLYHELCHLIEPNHGARFHALMDAFCPDWHERNALLAGR